MKIVYDHQAFSWQRHGGISRYYVELARRIGSRDGADVRVIAPVSFNEYLADLDPALVTTLRLPYGWPARILAKAVNPAATRAWLAFARPDLVHETYYRARRLAPAGAAVVTTVYDMIHERFPQLFSPSDPTAAAKAAAVRRADHVICISESTRRDLQEILGVPSVKLSVVHLGSSFRPSEGSAASAPVAGPFLLHVGERGKHKNFPALLEAYAQASRLREGFRLVCFGGGPFSAEERSALEARGLSSQRVLQVAGSDRVLASLYARASVFVCPSLMEGFGIPVLEAFSCGCPVACSATSSLPEVAGDGAAYFDPRDPGSIGEAVLRVLEDDDLRAGLVARGRIRATTLTWDRCADETFAVYQRLMKSRR